MSIVSAKLRKISNRPLRRVIFRLLCAVLLGRDRAHYEGWLPSLRLELATAERFGEVVYKGARVGTLVRSIEVLANSPPEEVVVIGSGPSVSEANLNLVLPGTAILLNGAINLGLTHGIKPLAIAIEDERFVWRHFDLMRSAISNDVPMMLSPSVLRAICEIDPGWLSEKRVVLIDNVLKPYDHSRRRISEIVDFRYIRASSAGSCLSLLPDRGVFQAGSVAVSAFQFAMYYRPNKIGFLGVDINNSGLPRFYEVSGNAAYSGILQAKLRILNFMSLGLVVASDLGISVVTYSAQSALREVGMPFDRRLTN